MQTADVIIEGIPNHSVVQAFVIDGDMKEVHFYVRRYTNEFMYGWKQSFILTVKDRSSGKKISSFEVSPSSKVNKKIVKKFNEPVNITTQISGRIPMNFFQTSPHMASDNPDISGVLDNLREVNRILQWNMNYRVLNDKDSQKEIDDSDWPELKEAYGALRNGSYRADILRYYLLYKYGGMYTDDKTVFKFPVDTYLRDILLDEKGCDGIVLNHSPPHGCEIAFLLSRKGSPIFKEVLERAINNINKRDYTTDAYEITGNGCFNKTYWKHHKLEGRWISCLGERLYTFHKDARDSLIYDNGQLIIDQNTTTCNWKDKRGNPNYYLNLYNDRKIFIDGNENPPLSNKIPQLVVFIFLLTFLMFMVIY